MTNEQRKQYPHNWPELALRCKEQAGWKCEHCGRQHRSLAISRRWNLFTIYLHAAHKHGSKKSDPAPTLLCLCIFCHARYDTEFRMRALVVRLERMKHRKLLSNFYLTQEQEVLCQPH